MFRTPIDLHEPLKRGDIIELDFRTTTWVWSQAAEIAMIEAYCEAYREDWEILSNSLPEANKITFRIKVLSDVTTSKSPYQAAGVAITCQTVGNIIIAAGLVTWLVLIAGYLVAREGKEIVSAMTSSTGGQFALAGMGAVGVAILLYIVTKALGMWK